MCVCVCVYSCEYIKAILIRILVYEIRSSVFYAYSVHTLSRPVVCKRRSWAMRQESVSEAGGKQGALRSHAQSHSSLISHGASSAHDPTMGGEVVRVGNIQSSCRHQLFLCVSCIWKWSYIRTPVSKQKTGVDWRVKKKTAGWNNGVSSLLFSNLFCVCVFTVSIRNVRRKEARKEGRRRLLIGGFFFCLSVLGEGFSAGRERCRTWHIKRKLCGLLSTRWRPAMWVLKSVSFLCILSYFLMGFWSIQMGSGSSHLERKMGKRDLIARVKWGRRVAATASFILWSSRYWQNHNRACNCASAIWVSSLAFPAEWGSFFGPKCAHLHATKW
jgi:hypothetical protein